MSIVICKLPRAGLANQLFLIANAELYGRKYSYSVHYTNFFQIKVGPYLRREKSKRNYLGFFYFQKISLANLFVRLKIKFSNNIVYDPLIGQKPNRDSIIFFKSLPHWSKYFDYYQNDKELVRELIFNALNPSIKKQVIALQNLDVAVHVRMGDFNKLNEGIDFKSVGATRTPFDYFVSEINKIQAEYPTYKITIFSDGFIEELQPLLNLPNTVLFETINDLVDLYQMSKSKILITSAGSTYSYWAGFLGDSKIIQHPDHKIIIR